MDDDYDAQRAVQKNRIRRRGIYLLPNLFTLAALFAGFYAIVQAMNLNFDQAAIAIFVAMVLDGLDGRVARLTKTQSAFGAEFDSLADMVSFGAAPALVIYEWVLRDMGKLWLDRGLPLLRVRGAAPRALQHDARRHRQALVHRHPQSRGGGARRRLRVDGRRLRHRPADACAGGRCSSRCSPA